MPELPEVETITRGLSEKLIGHRITDILVENPKSFQGDTKKVIGKEIKSIERRAKLIWCNLGKTSLLFHLKMTGQLIYQHTNKRFAGGHPSHDWHAELPNKYTRIIFTFNDGSRLFFNDLRKFGWCKVIGNNEIESILQKYGPEPFSSDFTPEYLYKRAQTVPNRNIKQFLMDQTIIAGIGNIYNDETLFLARLSPLTKVGKLSIENWGDIHKQLLATLDKAIHYGGTTDSDYVNSKGKKGGMQNHLNVYHRTGLSCKNCDGTVKRIKIASRGTYFCPNCQKELK